MKRNTNLSSDNINSSANVSVYGRRQASNSRKPLASTTSSFSDPSGPRPRSPSERSCLGNLSDFQASNMFNTNAFRELSDDEGSVRSMKRASQTKQAAENKKPRSTSTNEVIEDSHIDDAKYLQKALTKYRSGRQQMAFQVKLPEWDATACERFSIFMRALSFQEKYSTSCLYYECPTREGLIDKISEKLQKRIDHLTETSRSRAMTLPDDSNTENIIIESRNRTTSLQIETDPQNFAAFKPKLGNTLSNLGFRDRTSSSDTWESSQTPESLASSPYMYPVGVHPNYKENCDQLRTESPSTVQLGDELGRFPFFKEQPISQPIGSARQGQSSIASLSSSLSSSTCLLSRTVSLSEPLQGLTLQEADETGSQSTETYDDGLDYIETPIEGDLLDNEGSTAEIQSSRKVDAATALNGKAVENVSPIHASVTSRTTYSFFNSMFMQSVPSARDEVENAPQPKPFSVTSLTKPISNIFGIGNFLGRESTGIESHSNQTNKTPLSAAAATTMAMVTNNYSKKIESNDNHNGKDKSNFSKSATYPILCEPQSPAPPPKTATENIVVGYTTPVAVDKILSGVTYDWATTTAADKNICKRLLKKFAEVVDDSSCGVSLRHMEPVPLQRALTTLGIYGEPSRVSKKTIKPLFHHFHDRGSSMNPPADKDIVPETLYEETKRKANSYHQRLRLEHQNAASPNNVLMNDIQFSLLHSENDVKMPSIDSQSQRARANKLKSQQKWRRRSIALQKPFRDPNTSDSFSLSSHTNLTGYNKSNTQIDSDFPLVSSFVCNQENNGEKYRQVLRCQSESSSESGDTSPYGLQSRSLSPLNVINDNELLTSFGPSIKKGRLSSSSIASNTIYDHFDPKPKLHEMILRLHVIGGYFHNTFQEQYPIITPPSSTDDRVAGLHFSNTDGCLMIRLYYPKLSTERSICLGSSWHYIMAKPTGYIIFDRSLEEIAILNVSNQQSTQPQHQVIKGFFIPQHPSDWIDHSPMRREHSLHFEKLIASTSSVNTSIMSSNTSQIHPHRLNSSSMIHDEDAIVNNHDQSAMIITNDNEMNISSDSIMSTFSTTGNMILTSCVDNHVLENCFDSSDHDDCHMDSSSIDISSKGSLENIHIITTVLEYLLDFNIANLRKYQNYFLVNKTWALAVFKQYASFKSLSRNIQKLDYHQWKNYMMKFPWGKYLGEGACKRVYLVQGGDSNNNYYAVSLIDMIDMEAKEMTNAITQELTISMICSSLVTLNICPNLVLIWSIFQSNYYPIKDLWENQTKLNNQKAIPNLIQWPKQIQSYKDHRKVKTPIYQYIRMEYCKGGDLDEYLHSIQTFSPQRIKIYLFQIFFSIYCCREQLYLRHYDLKLLNFLVTTPDNLPEHKDTTNLTKESKPLLFDNNIKQSMNYFESYSNTAESFVGIRGKLQRVNSMRKNCDPVMNMDIGFGQYTYRLPLSLSNYYDLVKLTDFGTSHIGKSGFGEQISIDQFTTQENTPIEFLILGSDARQDYSADTFCLGLSMFHLILGYNPYEIHMKNIYCPDFLIEKLKRHWLSNDQSNCYYVIREVIDSLAVDDSSSDNPNDDPRLVMYHTLYRYFVLFSNLPEFIKCCDEIYSSYPVWKDCCDMLGLTKDIHINNDAIINKKKLSKRDKCLKQFMDDKKQWCILSGSHQTILEFRNRLQDLGEGGMKLLEKLLHFDPSRRCPLHEALLNPIFDEFKYNHQQAEDIPVTSYKYYYRDNQYGVDALPML